MKTRQVFREYLVSWTLREIADEFEAAGLQCNLEHLPAVSGQRRRLIEQYYHAVDWSDSRDVQKVLKAYENVLIKARERQKLHSLSVSIQGETQSDAETLSIIRMVDAVRRDGFQIEGDRIVTGAGLPALEDIKESVTSFDTNHLNDQIHRIEQSVNADPALAIGTAKELIETCCKTILAERGKPVTSCPDMPTLTRETLRELKLIPDSVPESSRGGDVIKRLLNNLGAIGHGLAELRGLYGTGHGKHGKATGLTPRHAKLAAGAAATLARFLFETHGETER